MDTREVVIELLSQLGSNREAREYLLKYSGESSQFAVIKVGGDVVRDNLDAVVSALGFLQHVGLAPIVVHGAGAQLNAALKKAGVASKTIDGVRVTTPKVMSVIRPVVYDENLQLVIAMEERGIRTRALQHGVFDCEYEDKEKFGLFGRVTKVNMEPILGALDVGALPVISCLGETPGGQMMNMNADDAATHLVRAIQPLKTIFLTPTGGWLDGDGRTITSINLETDYRDLLEADWVDSDMRLKLIQIEDLLAELPPSSSVSITSAANLTRELFTHRGAGTLVRRGEGFETLQSFDGRKSEIKALIDACFDRQLHESYFDKVAVDSIIWATSGRATAVIDRGLNGVAYLDKFAVTPSAQGDGVGTALWKQMREKYTQVYWRSRITNSINGWYGRNSDFSIRRGNWNVFGFGVTDLSVITKLVHDAVKRTEYWEDMATGTE